MPITEPSLPGFDREDVREKPTRVVHVQGGGVPGGHYVIQKEGAKPFVPPMRECASIGLRYTDRVVDIGAYVGTYSLRAARFPVASVVAYEPTPRSFEVLRRYDLPNLRVERAAVIGDSRRETELYVSSGIGVTNSLAKKRGKAYSISVPAVCYDVAVAGATIVKVDIEGGEYAIPLDILVPPTARAIIFDFHPVGDDWIDRAEEIIALFEDSGFRAVIRPDWGNGWKYNGSWFRERPDRGAVCEPMLYGAVCCGCSGALHGGEIRESRFSRSICSACSRSWSSRHRVGYSVRDRAYAL